MIRGIIIAGGTGGHIYPGIAVGKELKKRYPNIDILFVGRNREMERDIYKKEGFPFIGINIKSGGIKFFIGFVESLSILISYKPHFVFGLGSYISFPMIFWANLFGIPTFLQEQNVVPGVATRLLQGRVNKVFLGYGESSSYIKFKDRISVTGNPLRFKEDNKLYNQRRDILVFGGSLGARKISEAVVGVVKFIRENKISFGYRFILITGKDDYERFLPYEDKKMLRVYPYVNNMEEFYKRAILVISRAGALTVSEIGYFGLPAILIPYPLAKENHQYFNASLLVKCGMAILLEDRKIEVDLLWKEIYNILGNRKKLKSLNHKSFKFLFRKSKEKIAKSMIKFIREQKGDQ